MNKKIKGHDLYKMIAEGTLKKGDKLIDENERNWEFDGNDFLVKDGYSTYTDLKFATMDFEILEDEEEIDIQGIEEKDISYVICDSDFEDGCITKLLNRFFKENQKYIDEILKAVKQLDKKNK